MNIVPVIFKFRACITGGARNSAEAAFKLKALCREALSSRHHHEIVDVFRNPKKAARDDVLLPPILLRILSEPIGRTLAATPIMLRALGKSP